MRWKLNGYELKYNPKSDSKSWSAEQEITMNMNGNTSNPNLVYSGTQTFTIDVHNRPTYISKNPIISGDYISISEQITTGRLVLLKKNSTFSYISNNGTNNGTYSITQGNTTLPSGNPISLAYTSSGIAFLYKESDKSTIVMTDNGGVGSRKYIYDSTMGDINNLISIYWDADQRIYGVNPYGKIYLINMITGSQSFLYEFPDYEENKKNNYKRYTSILPIEKNDYRFIGVVRDKNSVLFLNDELEPVCKVEPRINNIIDVSFGANSEKYFLIMNGNVYEMSPNMSRIDVEIIKNITSDGAVTIYDELGFPSVLSLSNVNITRKRGLQEANYEISFTGDIAYSNQTFDNKWMKRNR